MRVIYSSCIMCKCKFQQRLVCPSKWIHPLKSIFLQRSVGWITAGSYLSFIFLYPILLMFCLYIISLNTCNSNTMVIPSWFSSLYLSIKFQILILITSQLLEMSTKMNSFGHFGSSKTGITDHNSFALPKICQAIFLYFFYAPVRLKWHTGCNKVAY
jgi:hypothetical protein